MSVRCVSCPSLFIRRSVEIGERDFEIFFRNCGRRTFSRGTSATNHSEWAGAPVACRCGGDACAANAAAQLTRSARTTSRIKKVGVNSRHRSAPLANAHPRRVTIRSADPLLVCCDDLFLNCCYGAPVGFSANLRMASSTILCWRPIGSAYRVVTGPLIEGITGLKPNPNPYPYP